MRFFSNFLAYLFELWHKFVSPALPNACRHEPTCSVYSAQALRGHGLLQGLALSVKRIIRCHPWGSAGYDPVPLSKKGS